MDAVNPDREGVMTKKPYMRLMYDIRLKLKQALSANEVPDYPQNVNNIDGLFVEAEKVVHENWSKYVSGLFDERREAWLSKIDPDNEEYKELREILADRETFEKKLRLYQMGPLEPLRSIFPEEWYKLLIASSERQLAQTSLINYWVKNSKGRLSEQLGMQEDELKLVIEMGGLLGKYFNTAFLKQTELADTAGGSSTTPMGDKTGVSRIYDVYKVEGDDFEIKTYDEVFNFEWTKIVQHFKYFSEKTSKLLKEGRLPDSYKGMPKYLNILAETYGSQEKDPEKLQEKWDELDEACRELAESGCPLSILGQNVPGVAGEANKVDIELRIGYRDKKSESLEKKITDFKDNAQNILDSKKSALSEEFSIAKPTVNRQLFALGTNLVWETLAETRKEVTNVHYNTVAKEGAAMKGIMDNLFAENKMDDKKYEDAMVIDTSLHEIGHGILPIEDENIAERIGITSESTILEELKAETASFLVLKNYIASGKEVDIETQVMTKIAVLIGYILNASSEEGGSNEMYYYTGVIILKELMDKGILQKKGNTYGVSDAPRAIDVIAEMGGKIISEYYENKDSNPQNVSQNIGKLRELKSDPGIAELMKSVKEVQTK